MQNLPIENLLISVIQNFHIGKKGGVGAGVRITEGTFSREFGTQC